LERCGTVLGTGLEMVGADINGRPATRFGTGRLPPYVGACRGNDFADRL
jgi:hypothetical protein